MKRVPIIFTIVLLTACSGKSNWTKDERTEFMDDCTSKMVANGETQESARTYCGCCLGELETKFTTGTEARSELTDSQMDEIEASCARQMELR